MQIRRATAADAAGLAQLVRQYWEFEGIRGFDAARIAALLSQLLARPESGAAWLAEAAAKPCGYLIAVFMFSLEHGGTMAEIDEFFVRPEARSSGLGAMLLDRAQRDMAAGGIIRLQLQLGVHNQ